MKHHLLSASVFSLLFAVSGIQSDEKAPPVNFALEQNYKIPGFERNPMYSDLFYGKRDCVYLNKYWKLRKLPGTENNPQDDYGTKEGFYKQDYNDKEWVDQYVPWDWNTGLPAYKENSVISPTRKAEAVSYKSFSGIGWYRTDFDVPEKEKGKRVVLNFSHIEGSMKMWINGKEAGEYTSFALEHFRKTGKVSPCWTNNKSFDITDLVKSGGKNTIAIRMYCPQDRIYDKRTNFTSGGLMTPVRIDFLPTLYANKILVTPHADLKTITCKTYFVNTGAPLKTNISIKVSPWKSYRYNPPGEMKTTEKTFKDIKITSGESSQDFTFEINSPCVWNCDKPSLYHAEIFSDGKLAGQARFGIRSVETKGRDILLNGNPFYMRAIQHSGTLYRWGARDGLNDNDCLRILIDKIIKKNNINTIYPFNSGNHYSGWNSEWHAGPFFDIMDEEGIVCNDWILANVQSMPEVSYFTPGVLAMLKEHTEKMFNHPSLTTYVVGGETDVNKLDKENFVYERLKEFDKTRITCSKTGGWPTEEYIGKQKTDYNDVHDYTACHWGYADYLKDSTMYYHKGYEVIMGKETPMINGETMQVLGDLTQSRIFDLEGELDKIRKNYPSVDRAYYVKFIEKIKDMGGFYTYVLSDIGHMGFTNYAVRENLYREHAAIHKKVIETFRQQRKLLQGFALHHVSSLHFHPAKEKLEITKDFLTKTGGALHTVDILDDKITLPLSRVFKTTCAPLAIFVTDFKRNVIAGNKIEGKAVAVNDSTIPSGELKTSISAVDMNGKEIAKTLIDIGKVPVSGSAEKSFSMDIPEKQTSGEYTLKAELMDGKNIAHVNTYQGYILEKTRKFNYDAGKKIALYSANPEQTIKTASMHGGVYGTKPCKIPAEFDETLKIEKQITKNIFDKLAIKYTPIDDFGKLQDFDVLVIGFDSMDKKVEDAGKMISEWVEKGGKLICFEQFAPPPQGESNAGKTIPFCTSLSMNSYGKNADGKGSGSFNFADKIVPVHPAFKGLENSRAIADWDAFRGSVVEAGIEPMTEGIISGAKLCWPYKMGMAAAEVKNQKGLIFFSQILATPRYGKDSVATQYMENLLTYVLSNDFDGRFAAESRSEQKKILAKENTLMIDLKTAANCPLEGTPDGKKLKEDQGWIDEKADRNDNLLSCYRGSKKVLTPGKILPVHEIPFSIIDTAANNGKGCAVVSKTETGKKYFPEKLEIKVHSGAKRIFLLITAICPQPVSGEQIGRVIMHYSENTMGATAGASIPLVFNKNISHWWNYRSLDMNADEIKFGKGRSCVSLFFIEWENIHKDSGIEKIELVAEKNADIALIAVTLEKIEAKLNK